MSRGCAASGPAAGTADEKVKAAGQLEGGLARLLLVAERYPELKASQNFRDLQYELAGTENRITVERQRYNDAARAYNTASASSRRASLPACAVSPPTPRTSRPATGPKNAPKVDFGT